jgi:hypothetical protein
MLAYGSRSVFRRFCLPCVWPCVHWVFSCMDQLCSSGSGRHAFVIWIEFFLSAHSFCFLPAHSVTPELACAGHICLWVSSPALELLCWLRTCNTLLTHAVIWPILLWHLVCRVDDYWLGYKFFCYAYYSRSVQHEAEFRESILGACFFPPSCIFCPSLWNSLPCPMPWTSTFFVPLMAARMLL